MRTSRWCLPLVLFVLWPGASAPAAVTFALTERDQQEAIAVGRQSIYGAGFGAEWQVINAAGDALAVMTPFHRLALAARNAAFRSEAMRPRDVETLVRISTGKLEFWATLHGSAPDFARHYAPTLVPAGQPAIRPSFVQNERTALAEGGGRYAARCLYVFPTEGLSPTGRLTLVVRTPSEAEIATFTMDLATMR
jgi:hypothetical protein